MSGRITTRHLITHGHVIVREFGVVVLLRAVWIALRGGGTFLEAIR
jgi:hypothetical protein